MSAATIDRGPGSLQPAADETDAEPRVPSRVRVLPIPLREPFEVVRIPFDDRPGPPPGQGVLPLEFGAKRPPRRGRPGSAPPLPTRAEPGPPAGLPDPEEWAAGFVQAAMEVSVGLRSASQLIRWTTPEVHALLARRHALTSRARGSGTAPAVKPRVRTVLTSYPVPGVCEATGVMSDRGRVRAVAFRMEACERRWRVTAMELG